MLEQLLDFFKSNFQTIILVLIGLLISYIIYYFYRKSKCVQNNQIYKLVNDNMSSKTMNITDTNSSYEEETENEEQTNAKPKEDSKEEPKPKTEYNYKQSIEELINLCSEDFDISIDEISSDDDEEEKSELIEDLPVYNHDDIKIIKDTNTSNIVSIVLEEEPKKEAEEPKKEAEEPKKEAEEPKDKKPKKINLMNK
jgi:hypothetical protein